MEEHLLQPNPWMILPFALLLGAIALGPLINGDWWGKHYAKVALGLGAITLAYYLLGLHAGERALHVAHEYASFIILIGSLFVVSGGIHMTVKGEATPLENVLFLMIGAVVANLLGTTGASMLLIRPWIRMNKYRITAHHIVFFIFVVSNVGGCLTPIGDPPLFLGYLKGVPFLWVLEHCWPMWATALGVLLVMFYMVDSFNYRRAPKAVRDLIAAPRDEFKFQGLHNLFFLGLILAAVFVNHPIFLRELLMVAAAVGSWFTTRKPVHEANHFTFHPIKEVAILFVGIFSTMMPALDWLQANAAHYADKLGGFSPTLFYWGSGTLSSVLDNAPTYLSFLSAAAGEAVAHPAQVNAMTGTPGFAGLLVAISVGSVFFGANTYIGNGPNFMVKAIADHQKVRTPGFLGYVFKFTLPVMLPMLLIVWAIFFRHHGAVPN
ncbi:MAG TPA: sodium:proton antiporter [Verrucomicrobiae bacterium]|nr:sodium:proton antiporter [Verrucomicrobiae bacterium]